MVDKGGQYILGTGDYRQREKDDQVDLPWTPYWDPKSKWYGEEGSDCAGFALCWTWKLKRHRPGFNKGAWATVVDYINCNSALEDGLHKQELFTTLPEGACVQPGDVLAYPTIYVVKDGKRKKFVGHCAVVEVVPIGFKYGDWSALTIIQAHGPNGRAPGVVRTDGSVFERHTSLWGKLEHRTRVVRPHERL